MVVEEIREDQNDFMWSLGHCVQMLHKAELLWVQFCSTTGLFTLASLCTLHLAKFVDDLALLALQM